jgi:hypothetical protein
MTSDTFRGLVTGLLVGAVAWTGWIGPYVVDEVSAVAAQKAQPKIVVQQFELNLIVEPVRPPLDLMTRVLVEPIRVSKKEFDCLAKNIFFEAGVEDRDGKIAVGQLVIQRMENKRWSQSICDVVYSKYQFSWTSDSEKKKETPSGVLWDASRRAARDVLAGERIPELMDALFYHANYISPPDWASEQYKVAQIGTHVFYNNDLKKDSK